MDSNAVEIVEKTTPFQGYFRVDRYRLRHRLHQGGVSDVMVREIFERGHAVAVVLYDPIRDEMVLIDQFRPGAYAAGWDPWLTEIVAGIIEPGETPEEVARREAVEEAGCTIQELVFLCRYLTSPGASTESIVMFCGRVDTTDVGGVHGLGAEHEDIKVNAVSCAEAFRRLDSGEISNGMTMIGLQWFRMRREELRRAWSGA